MNAVIIVPHFIKVLSPNSIQNNMNLNFKHKWWTLTFKMKFQNMILKQLQNFRQSHHISSQILQNVKKHGDHLFSKLQATLQDLMFGKLN